MNLALWICQGLLAAVFALSGAMKLSWDKDRLIASGQTGVAPFPVPVIRLTAASELLATVGLILPWVTGTAPVLTPLAALWLCVVMVGAAIAHSSLREPAAVAANAVLFALALFVALGRF